MMERDELLGREQESWDAFVAAVEALPEARRDQAGVVPGWSAKDLTWHNAFWAGYAGDVLGRIADGRPEPPEQDWDAFNAKVTEDGRALSWDEIWSQAARLRAKARTALERFDDVTEDAAREFREETYEHYEEHTAEVVAFAAG
jgi:DinB superfamily